ncbi:MAG: efflux RND transporter permease subunit [Candidatus Kapaibacteriales bacterium]
MILAKIATQRPVLITTLVIVFIFFGILSYFSLNIDSLPEVKIPYITIKTVFPGAGPKDVENLITKKIEDEISTISGIDRITSYSMDNASIVLIQFKLGKNVDIANQEVKDKIDKIINDLPVESQKPIIQKVDIQSFSIMDLVVTGSLSPTEIREFVDKKIKDRLSQVPGVANIEIIGGQEKVIKVVFDNKTVYENNISLPNMVQILRSNNLDLPGGSFNLNYDEFNVRIKGAFQSVENLSNLRYPTPFGPKKLDQVASIIDTGKDVRERTIFVDNIKLLKQDNVVRLSIIKSSDANIVKVCEEIEKLLPELQNQFPKGLTISKVLDQSKFTKGTFSDTMSNIYLGIAFTGLILFLFLFDWKSTFIVAITMPVSIFSSFLLFKAFNLSLNILSLMGISASIGALVANSIVVLENIHRFRLLGYSSKDAAYLGTSEVVVAVLASTLTNVIVFLPIANMSSIVGQMLKELALAATFTTLFSLLFSFILTPMLSSLLLSANNKNDSKLFRLHNKFDNFLTKVYRELLTKVIDKKSRSALIVFFTFLFFIITIIFLTPRIGFEFIPAVDNSEIILEIELPNSSNLESTSKKVNEIENIIRKHREVVSILTDIGKKDKLNTGSNLAIMDIKLCEPFERDKTLDQMITILKNELDQVTNVKLNVKRKELMEGMTNPIEFYLLGQNIDTLEKYRNIMITKMKNIPGLINFDNSVRTGKPEIIIFPKREILAEIGLNITEIAYTLRAALEGIESTVYREEGNEYDIIITLKDQNVNSPEKIENIGIVGPYGTYRLSQLADVKYSFGVSRIIRFDKYKSVMFTGSNSPEVPLGNVTREIEKIMKEISLPQGYSFRWSGTTKMMNEMKNDMLIAFIIATILTYLLLSAILESFIQSLYTLLSLPLGLIGAILLMFITGTKFNLPSLIGVILLIGVVVNNAILILDYTNKLIRENKLRKKDALIEAATTKLKAQIMTSSALILGMLPMALQIGEFGREIRAPFGIVSIGGLVVSTLLTLFVIPSFYNLFKREKN